MKKIYSLFFLLLSYTTTHAQNFQNPSLESWGIPGTCEINTAPDNWANFSNTGVGPDEGNFLLCPSTIPNHASDGSVYARMLAGNKISGEGMSQVVSGFVIGSEYTLTFDYAGSNLYGGTDDIRFFIYINGVKTDSTVDFHSTDTAWSTYHLYFVAHAVTETFGFRCYTAQNAFSGGSGGIDNFRITDPSVGINPLVSDPNVIVSPNPFQNILTVRTDHSSDYEIILFDITGRPVLQQSFSNTVSLNIETFAKGMYLYTLKNRDLIIKKGKVVND